MFEQRMTDVNLRISTWGEPAHTHWLDAMAKARATHVEWLQKTPTEQAVWGAQLAFGEDLSVPPTVSRLESILRVDLL
eukprot:7358571-Prorocentrum_lima.AAC.1